MIVPVILSGGSGTRLWPMSTPERPKQFLPLVGEQSLFQATLERVADRQSYHPPVVVSNANHRELCMEELGEHQGASLILEPCARNTAAAIIMAAELVNRTFGPDQIMLVMPSDHLIGEVASFHRAVALGQAAAKLGRLVTFGVMPTGPETGYGYLEAGAELDAAPGIFEVAKFVEKPQLEAATQMVESGRFFWNGGIFMFRAGDVIAEAGQHAPEILAASNEAMAHAHTDERCVYPSQVHLDPCPNISVDYAIMEKSDRVAMVPLDARWSDVGSWDALAEVDEATPVETRATAIDANNCYVRSDGIKVSLLGVDDLIVVAAADQVLVMRKGHSQEIRKLADRAARENR
jgi:mannose-1-phosphate guanylyltransferase/mannose-1-phosphate guanylyltransferase/mannose-6-phosphate isomerase